MCLPLDAGLGLHRKYQISAGDGLSLVCGLLFLFLVLMGWMHVNVIGEMRTGNQQLDERNLVGR